jgi:hypothetical protein
LKILITNVELDLHRGTELVVRDLALEYRRCGHEPAVYSPKLGSVAEEIQSSGVKVTDRLDRLPFTPDVIHGHHLQTIEAMLHFPSVPGIHVCHGATGLREMPVYFPRIFCYAAVDERCKKRIEGIPEIPARRIRVVWNSVDLARFQQRGPLPPKPRRALVFSNQASRFTHLSAVRKACRRAGLDLDVVGVDSGNPAANPERILPAYDLVFAKARCALEALASGNAVVLCDATGLGPLVSTTNFDSLRPMNFGAGVLVKPLRPNLIGEEIERYNANDATAVCQRVRTEAGLTEAAQCWFQIYDQAIEEFRGTPRNPDDELRAIAAYLATWSYDKRVQWEREQLQKLKSIPVIGAPLLHLARTTLRRWTGRWGMP